MVVATLHPSEGGGDHSSFPERVVVAPPFPGDGAGGTPLPFRG